MTKFSELAKQSRDYACVERAISYIEAHDCDRLEPDAVAAAVGLSTVQFQRMLKRWAGISPKHFLKFLTLDHTRSCLKQSASVLDVDLSGTGCLQELSVNYKTKTPREFKEGGDGVEIFYGVHPSPFGPCFIGETECGVCALGFGKDGAQDAPLADFRRRWPNAQFRYDQPRRTATVARIFADGFGRLALDLRGTNFQLKVWRALLRIPPGAMVSYDALASALDNPGAVRAVGSAVAANPVSYLIPCHRVIRKSGHFHNYYWGSERKRAILAWEASHFAPAA